MILTRYYMFVIVKIELFFCFYTRVQLHLRQQTTQYVYLQPSWIALC